MEILIRQGWVLTNLVVSSIIALLVTSYKEILQQHISYIIIWTIYINAIITISVQNIQSFYNVLLYNKSINLFIKRELITCLTLVLGHILVTIVITPMIIEIDMFKLLLVMLTGFISIPCCISVNILTTLTFKKLRWNYQRDSITVATLINQLIIACLYYNTVIYYVI